MDMGAIVSQVASVCLGVLGLTLLMCFIRLRKGPYLADRVLALDLMTTILMGIIAAYAIYSRQKVFVDVVVVLALVAFISTVVFARHIERDAHKKSLEGRLEK